MGEGDAVWQRAGVLGHVSDSTPLVIPYRSIGARERTPGPKPNCACTALLRPLPSFFSRPKGRESTLVLHWTSFTLEANSRPKLPTLGPFSPFFASGVDSRPKKSKNSLDSRPSGLGSGGETRSHTFLKSILLRRSLKVLRNSGIHKNGSIGLIKMR